MKIPRLKGILTNSKNLLIIPKYIINLEISFIFHLLGFLKNSLSTLSVEIVKRGKSLNKLLSRICEGKRGMNFKNKEEDATVIILPKFALIVFKIYLVIFANVLLPSI